jgi:hypothetical protein
MTGAGRREPARSVLIQVALVVTLIALFASLVPALLDLTMRGIVFENVGITDLGRDLLGVSALEQGGTPYQQIDDLIAQYGSPDLPLSGPPRLSGWVVHPPLALAGARVLLDGYGSGAELVGRRLSAAAVVGLALAVVVVLRRRKPSWTAPAAIAMLVWVPTLTDIVWIQGNAIAGLGLLAVAVLDGQGRRKTARLILGLLVAWKPWLAVFALALPRSSSVLRDLIVVAGTAGLATVAVLPWVGGFDSLWAWVSEALPGNMVEARTTGSNLSWTSAIGSGTATIVYLGAILAIPIVRRWLPRELWLLLPVWVATAMAPFVWDHYWLALAPVVWLVLSGAQSDQRIPAFGWMCLAVLPVALSSLGQPGLENRVLPMVLAGVVLLLGSVLIDRRGVPFSPAGETDGLGIIHD